MDPKTSDNNPQSLYSRTAALTGQGRVKDSLVLLRRMAAANPRLTAELDQIENTYSLLTKYFLDGVRDDSRPRMLAELRLNLLDIADRLDRVRRAHEDSGLYYSETRMMSYRPLSLRNLLGQYKDLTEKVTLKNQLGAPNLAEMKNREQILERIFNYVWTLGYDAKGDLKVVRDVVIASEREDAALATLLVSALLMALLEWYDADKLQTLLSVYESSATEGLAAKSLTALILVLARHGERIAADRRLIERLEALKDSLISFRRLRETVRSIIRTRDTDRVTDKMRNEVLPGMMKLGPDMMRKLQEASEEGGMDAIEENPEWEEILNKSGLGDRIKELTEMQMEGADVMMVAFSNLKGFPFFSKMYNWFLPFSTDLSVLHEGAAGELMASGGAVNMLLENSGIMCDSDKYSFILALATMPADRRQVMTAQLEAQSEQMRENGLESSPKDGRPEYDVENEKYIRNLYRFFKLFSKHSEFADPFATPLDFQNLPVVAEILNESDVMETITEFYFKRGYYREALPMLRQLAEERGDDAHLWEKLGYAIEQLPECDIKEALACYMKAELLSPDSRWLARRIGNAYGALGNWRMAEEYLVKACGDSERVAEMLELAEAKRNAGHLTEAAKDLYKANYIEPENLKVRYALAKIEMERGEYEKALKFAMPRTGDKLPDEHFRLLGHIYLLKKEYRHAAEAYARTIRPEHKRREWKRDILADRPLLLRLGADGREIDLLLDSLV